jgi:hypothetical protein
VQPPESNAPTQPQLASNLTEYVASKQRMQPIVTRFERG